MKINNTIAKKLKKDFPIFKNNKGLVYLDNAATSQRPKQVIGAVTEFYEKDNANISRGLYALAERATQKYEEARKIIAKFIGSNYKEIIFTRNTTESINLLSYVISSILPKSKNEIVLTEMEHHSNLVPWQQLAKREGFKLKFVKVKDDYTLDMEDAKKQITDKTAIFAFTHVSNVLGTINDAKKLVELGKSKGAITIIDAAQSIQHLKVDVNEIGCDFLAFSSHKMMGPTGVGVLYGRKELLEKLTPFNFGGGMIKRVSLRDADWENPPEKFEAGTQHIGQAIGLAESVKYLQKIGIENIADWEKNLLKYTLDKLKLIQEIKIYNPGENKSVGIISFNLKGLHPHDVAQLLNEDKIAVRAGHNCAMPLMEKLGIQGVSRVSFSFFNTIEDIDKFVNALKKIIEKFN